MKQIETTDHQEHIKCSCCGVTVDILEAQLGKSMDEQKCHMCYQRTQSPDLRKVIDYPAMDLKK